MRRLVILITLKSQIDEHSLHLSMEYVHKLGERRSSLGIAMEALLHDVVPAKVLSVGRGLFA